MSGIVYPPLLAEDKMWWLRIVYKKCEPPINSHFSAIVCTESGKGKSSDSVMMCYAQYPDLDINESFAFSAREFLNISKQHKPRHFPVVLDDAGLSAFSGDALTKEVKAISKIAQSIRHKHFQVVLNIPSFDLLAKSVRVTNHYYLEPVWIDYDLEVCHTKFQRIRMNPFSGDILRKNMIKRMTRINEVTGYEEHYLQKILTLPFPKPPKKLWNEYEAIKEERLDKFREDTGKEVEVAHQKRIKQIAPTDKVIQSIIDSTPQKFMLNGKIDLALIKQEFDIGVNRAQLIAKVANEKHGTKVKEYI